MKNKLEILNTCVAEYDAIVIGAGHAGSEAALALARLGHKTLVVTISLDNVSLLACNPSIGGTSKGQIVAEIDALGGQMGIIADKATIQTRMLNLSKGPAVHSLRVQVDKNKYHEEMKAVLENTPNLFLKQGEVKRILTISDISDEENYNKKNICVSSIKSEKAQKNKDGLNLKKVCGVELSTGEVYACKTVVVATGVYLQSNIIMGEYIKNIGPSGFAAANDLTQSLIDLGIEIKRFKTGTPARVNKNSVDFSSLEVQHGDEDTPNFSALTKGKRENKVDCYLTYTNLITHKIIKDNLHKAPMYSGSIKGVGPRYCPSIETKIVRFEDKDRHQLFLEPETLNGQEIYIQGLSTSFSCDLQEKIIHSIKGLENAFVMRNAYAIEYDAINSQELDLSLEHKKISGLFFAGQVNGTSGYEEAGGQGIIAGINAARKLENKSPIILKRSDAYIGVLIDDLITKGTEEPYRMMTSRAEYRLLLRQSNADLRLTKLAIDIGLASEERKIKFENKLQQIKKARQIFDETLSLTQVNELLISKTLQPANHGMKINSLVKRDGIEVDDILKLNQFKNCDEEAIREVFIESKYEGYIARTEAEVERAKKDEEILLDKDLDYLKIKGLKIEAANKLNLIKPSNLGQASRISGVSPADILVLTIYMKMNKKQN